MLRLLYYLSVGDQVAAKSFTTQIYDQVLSIGDSTLIPMAESLNVLGGNERTYTHVQELLAYTEGYLSSPFPSLPLWLPVSGAFLIFLVFGLLVWDVLTFRRAIRDLKMHISNIRLGIFYKHTLLKGDFASLSDSLVDLAEDVDRTRRNARQLIQT
ncbi:MAG: hypothetical protein GXO39_09495 [Thermotogae bacterium]|nr:hypothetical protein [Thermotogota bacterium]